MKARRAKEEATLVVESFYREILNRGADPSGLQTYLGLVSKEGISRAVPQMLRSFLNSSEFKALVSASQRSYSLDYQPRRGSYDAHGGQASITFIQTADPFKYYPMLVETSKTIIAYCEKQGFGYESFVGYKRGGKHAWHATYNRIPMLRDLLARGQTGWVVYLDADAYVVNFQFDLKSYLADKASLAAVFAPGANQGWWDVNAGVFMINLDSDQARKLIIRWNELFDSIPDECFSLDAAWGESFPEDQNILQGILQDGHSSDQFHIEQKELINSPHASFIRTYMRSHTSGGLADRLTWIRLDIESTLGLK